MEAGLEPTPVALKRDHLPTDFTPYVKLSFATNNFFKPLVVESLKEFYVQPN